MVEDPTRADGAYPANSLNGFLGRSLRELHELAHGEGCWCPVYGAGVSDGKAVFAYDSPVPYTWAT